MAAYLFKLEMLSFPHTLNNDNANFRLRIDVRYKATGDEFKTETVVMPGVDSYWECSATENQDAAKSGDKRKDRYVRLCVRTRRKLRNGRTAYEPSVDMDLAGDWDTSFRLNAEHLYQIRVTLLDVDRKDWFEKIGDVFKGALNLYPPTGILASTIGASLARTDHGILFVGVGTVNDERVVCRGGGYYIQLRVTDAETQHTEEEPAANPTVPA